MSFIEFKISDNLSFKRLEDIFNTLKSEKEIRVIDSKDKKWKELFGKEALSKFWWPTKQEFEEYQKLYFTTPLDKRSQDKRLQTPWDFESLIDAIKNGEYTLEKCSEVNIGVGRLEFEPWAYPYGGSESLQELIRCFGHKITKIED